MKRCFGLTEKVPITTKRMRKLAKRERNLYQCRLFGEIRIRESGMGKMGVGKPGIGETGMGKMLVCKPGISEMGVVKLGIVKMGVGKPGTGQTVRP